MFTEGNLLNGPLTRYLKLRVAHAPEMPGTFSPPPTSKETASLRFRHALWHVRHARAVMYVGIANPQWRENVPGIPGTCTIRNITYLVKGQCRMFFDRSFIQAFGNQGLYWQEVSVSLESEEDFRLYFVSTQGYENTPTALDDIEINTGFCEKNKGGLLK